jgi:hypothetical protein
VQKKQKVQQVGTPYFETVAMRLLDVQKDLRKNYDDAALAQIEIEVRPKPPILCNKGPFNTIFFKLDPSGNDCRQLSTLEKPSSQ